LDLGWVRAGVGQRVQDAEVDVPPDIGLGRLCWSLPPPTEQDNGQKTRTDAQEGGYQGHSQHLTQGRASDRKACSKPSPKSGAEGGDKGVRTERKEGQAARGTGREHGLLSPIFLRSRGSRVGGGPGGGRDSYSMG
jgi:hypothetical protein